MSGHSHWAGIKHKKALIDAKRGKLWSKLAKGIIIAAKLGGGDMDLNFRLRAAVEAAKAVSMPKDNIVRAIKKGTGELDGGNFEEVVYEGYGPGGVAIIVEALTDNRNRTATNVRTAFSKNGGNLGASGAVSHGFDRMGLITYPASAGDAEAIFEAALEAGAEDVSSNEDEHEIWTAMDALHEVAKALEATIGAADSAKLAWKPQTTTEVDEANAATLLKLVDTLEDDDDVQTVWGNYEVSDAVMEKLG